MIYMIAGLGVVKIGYTNNPRRRLSMLQTGQAHKLTLLRVFEGGKPEEALLHARFAELRKSGEWFTFSAEMLADVGLVEVRPAPPPPAPIAVSRSEEMEMAREITEMALSWKRAKAERDGAPL